MKSSVSLVFLEDCEFCEVFLKLFVDTMGNKKKKGNRYKSYKTKELVRKSSVDSQTSESRPRPAPTKSSSSRLKLAPSLASYSKTNASVLYDIVDLNILEQALKEIAVCKVCHTSLGLFRNTLSGLATEISFRCNACENVKKFSNCEEVCDQEINTTLGLILNQKFYALNLRLVYSLRT